MNQQNKLNLGRDFWWFRGGELLSDLGTGAQALALAWWILDSTGSATAMAWLLVPVTIVRLIANPLLAPLGDRFSRKSLMMIANVGLMSTTGVMVLMFSTSIMNMPWLIALSITQALFGALFNAGSHAVVANLVAKEHVQKATQQVQALNAITMMVGGIFGAGLVAFLGVTGAVTINGLSFLASTLGVAMIRANTTPQRTPSPFHFKAWQQDIQEGFNALVTVRVLLGITLVATLLNLAFAPMQIVIPYLVKETLGLTPWHVGLVEAALGLAMILGALTVGLLTQRLPKHQVMILGLTLPVIALAVASLWQQYWVFLTANFVTVLGVTWCNVLIGSQALTALPDHFRTRILSLLSTFATAAMPLGMALAGWIIDSAGAWFLLASMSAVLAISVPLMVLVPNLAEFFRRPTDNVAEWITDTYPKAFN